MRDLRILEIYRRVLPNYPSSSGEADFGFFVLPSGLRVMATNAEGWDHVSCSFPHRTPTWDEMSAAKELFFKDEELVVQFHVPKDDHINFHPHCLHLWRKHDFETPLPPQWMIAPKAK